MLSETEADRHKQRLLRVIAAMQKENLPWKRFHEYEAGLLEEFHLLAMEVGIVEAKAFAEVNSFLHLLEK